MRALFFILLSIFLPAVVRGQVRPDNFPVETTPTNSNFEFYTQKGGSARRATMDAVANYITPRIDAAPIAYTPTATGNPYADWRKFVTDPEGDLYYIDGNGDGMLIAASMVGVTDGDKGDIDVTSSGTVWTVDTGSITTVKIAANAVDSTKVGSGALSVTDLGQHSATSGQVLKWNGTQWAPGTESSGGHVILEGNTPRAQKDSLEFQSNSSIVFGASNTSTRTVVDATIEAGAVGAAEIAANAVDSTKICSGCVSVTDLGQHGASSGEALKWNGTQWAPGTDNNTDAQTLTIDSTLLTSLERFGVSISGGNTVNFDVPRATLDTFSLSGTTLSASVSTDAHPAYTVSFSGWDTDASNDLTTATSFSGDVSGAYNNLQLGTGAVSKTDLATTAVDSTRVPAGSLSVTDINQSGASTNHVLKWNASQWAPGFVTTANCDATITGSLLPSGTSGQTLRYGTSSWLASSLFRNDGTSLGVNGAPNASYMLHVKQGSSTSGLYVARNSGTEGVWLYHNGSATVRSSGGYNLKLYAENSAQISLVPGGGGGQIAQVDLTPLNPVTSVFGNSSGLNINPSYSPTSTGGDFSVLRIGGAIDQTYPAAQRVRGIGIFSSIDSVYAGFYGIEYRPQNALAFPETFLYQPIGAAVSNRLAGDLYIGTDTTLSAAKVQVLGDGATSSTYSLIVTNSGGTTSTAALVVRDDSRVGIGTNAPAEKLSVAGNVELTTAGNKLKIATGSNASMGTATLVAGTVTVSTTAVATGSTIFLTCNTPGGTQGFLSAPAASIVNGTSFVINSSSVTDTSTVNWWIIN